MQLKVHTRTLAEYVTRREEQGQPVSGVDKSQTGNRYEYSGYKTAIKRQVRGTSRTAILKI